MKIEGFFKDINGASRVTKRRLELFAAAPVAAVREDPINAVARALHPGKITFAVADVRDVSPTARTFRLVSKDVPLPVFEAGQYVSLDFRTGGTVTTRPYSISSAPFEARGEKPFIEITVRKKGRAFIPDYLFDSVKRGDVLTGSMPYGQFCYEPLRDSKNVVALVGGSGITPVYSMAREIMHGTLDFNLTILYGSTNASDVIFKDELDHLGCDRVKVIYVMSDDPDFEGEKGFISAEIIRKYSPEDASYFICGPQVMYSFIAGELKKLGVPRRRIRNEIMGAPADARKIPGFPPEALGRKVKITVMRGVREDVIEAASDEPVAVSLERAGIPIPTHCRSGACGYCRTELLSGEIFVRPDGDGRRLMDKEWGWFHPCASYPVGDLKIKIPII